MYLPSVRLGSWNHALGSGKIASFGRAGKIAGAVDFCHHHRHGLRRRATDTCRANGARFASGQAEENARSEGERQYTSWSPSTSKNTSLNLPVTEDGQQQPRRQLGPPAVVKAGGAHPRSPQAVSMEEFAALERKLAPPVAVEPPRRKTPEQIAMEEFAALERKLSPRPGAAAPLGAQGGSRGARPSPLTKPEEPDAEECCGNGCATCVWIGYWEELQAWEEAERERDEAPS